jgi:hypothetical protein
MASVVVLVAGGGLALAIGGRPGARPSRLGSRPSVTVTVAANARATAIPASFLGLSFESWGLQEFERHGALLARTLSLLRTPGGPPLLVRIGGNSSDRSFWDPSGRGLFRWAFAITPAYLRRTAALARSADLRLLIDLNMATARPAVSVRVAAAAARLLGTARIAGFEVGNEPDMFAHTGWVAAFSRQAGNAAASSMSATGYAHAFGTYARLLTPIAPHVALLGPALGYPRLDVGWLARLLSGPHPHLGLATGHLYPFSACARPSSPSYPTIDRLLSSTGTAGIARSIEPAVALARRAGLALRVTELNSVTCGGRAGVSDAFASALWAPEAMFELLRAGVAGVNVHVRAEAVNGAFALTAHGLVARPLLYGMILFARTVGTGSRLLETRDTAPRALRLGAWTVALPGGRLHVLLIDEGSRPARVLLHLPAVGIATIQRLRAPSVAARRGVTLDGRQLNARGRWRGRADPQTVAADAGVYTVTVPAGSAALVSVARAAV